ncbi:MAG: hypothetical protein QM499_11080 [Flavobacteriaceae bacterium]
MMLVILVTTYANSQNNDFILNSNTVTCKTPSSSSNLTELDNIRGLDHTNDLFYAKIYVHVLRKEQTPQLGQSVENVNRLMKVLYDDFDPLGFYFVWGGEIDYIDNNDYFNLPETYSNDIFNTNNHPDGIDIYLFDDTVINGFGLANGIGESTEFMIGGNWLGDQVLPLSRLKVISHEMGHVLFLWHTHHGTDPSDNQGDLNACAELVNGSVNNRVHCGDYIKDTPADPNINYNANRDTCVYEGGGADANGDAYQPDTSNLMSYTYPTCMGGFTPRQKSRMKNAFWYIDELYDTHLEEYTFIRANVDCYSCFGEDKTFEVTSSIDIAQLTVSSSNNIQTSVISSSSNSFTIEIENLLGNGEGESGFISITYNGNVVTTQPIWVGLPETIPANTLFGSSSSFPNQEMAYTIDSRLQGVSDYKWYFPEPNVEEDNFNNPIFDKWQYLAWDNYFINSYSLAGNQTGWVRVNGINPCGEGDNGTGNEICVINTSDPEGDTECEGPPPPPIVYYPNPADSLLEIDLSLQGYKTYTIIIYDQYQTVKYSDQSTNVIKTINVFNLVNGTYYLHIYDDNGDNILSRILIINH